MKIPLDTKFIITTIITFFILVIVVVSLNALGGTTLASVVGAVLTGFLLKFIDRLDYSATTHLDVSSALSQASSILAGIFILYGTTVFFRISISAFKIIYGDNYLFMPSFWLIGVLLDWGGFAIGGWLIGRLFPTHSMRVAAIAGFVLVISITLKDFSGEFADKLTPFLNGFVERGLVKQGTLDGNLLSVRVGGIIGGVARAYLAIIMARIASRKRLKSVLDNSIQK